jgi:hypothetical protein
MANNDKPDPITQHIIEHEAVIAAADNPHSHMEAISTIISAEVTAAALKRRAKYAFLPGDVVMLTELPANFFKGLPEEDQVEIKAAIGRSVQFIGYSWGLAELEFTDDQGAMHTIWVDPKLVTLIERPG